MAGFRPGIRKQDEDATQRVVRQAIEQQPGVVAIQSDIANAAPLDLCHEFRRSGEEGLAADHADVRMLLRLPRQMFASAETDSSQRSLTSSGNKPAGVSGAMSGTISNSGRSRFTRSR